MGPNKAARLKMLEPMMILTPHTTLLDEQSGDGGGNLWSCGAQRSNHAQHPPGKVKARLECFMASAEYNAGYRHPHDA
jgi:hypothetical protein